MKQIGLAGTVLLSVSASCVVCRNVWSAGVSAASSFGSVSPTQFAVPAWFEHAGSMQCTSTLKSPLKYCTQLTVSYTSIWLSTTGAWSYSSMSCSRSSVGSQLPGLLSFPSVWHPGSAQSANRSSKSVLSIPSEHSGAPPSGRNVTGPP